MRNPDFCICENKGAVTAKLISAFFSQHGYTIPLLKSETSSFYPSSVAAHAGLCRTWSEAAKTGFVASRLI